jgi:hypothetical protein
MRLALLTLVTSMLSAALFLIVALPAAAEPQERIGERIDLRFPHASFPADEPFHVVHGWGLTPDSSGHNAIGLWKFRLEVDGQRVEPDFVERAVDQSQNLLDRFWVFNFPQGLSAGVHSLTGYWIGPCQALVDNGFDVGEPCLQPNEQRIAIGPLTRSVAFMRRNLALGKPVTASSEYPGNEAPLAVDGDWFTYWSSGTFPPAWIEVDLGAVERVGEIDLGITQLPDCATTHRVYVRASTSDPYLLLDEFNGYTIDQQVLKFVAAAPQELRYVRVETTSSCSWVGWREIEVYRPGG